jgi:hypothetical protein
MNRDYALSSILKLPHPWPPVRDSLIYGDEDMKLTALTDGRLNLTALSPKISFTSQPIDIRSIKPRWVFLTITWGPSTVNLRINGQDLHEDSPGSSTLLLPSRPPVPDERSLDDPNASTKCQKWIQNRKSMFSGSKTPRTGRRLKTLQEEADDLSNSMRRLRHLNQQITAGHTYLLGTLAGEMRASVYWPIGRDAQPSQSYNPILLRMANVAELPLPVYFKPRGPVPAALRTAVTHLTADPPRLHREFGNDDVCDLQESLVQTTIRLGAAPGRTIKALELIKELAHTMGASHYDEDASEFLDILHAVRISDTDKATLLMCQIAETLVSLSEWVLSELKQRNLIG